MSGKRILAALAALVLSVPALSSVATAGQPFTGVDPNNNFNWKIDGSGLHVVIDSAAGGAFCLRGAQTLANSCATADLNWQSGGLGLTTLANGLAPFSRIDPTVSITATNSTGNVALTATGSPTQVVIYNADATNTAYVAIGTSSGVTTSATTGTPVGPGSTLVLAVGATPYLAAITSSSTAKLFATSGTGGPTGWGGGGGSGGGGGGAVTAVAGAFAAGSIVDLSATPTSGSAGDAIEKLAAGTAPANSLSIPAGTALIGKVGIDQTTPGTTNNVTVSTNVGTLPLISATASAPISSTAAATTLLVAASGSTKVYITHYHLVVSGAGTVALVAGTGGSCAGGLHYLEGASGHPLSYAANGGISAGSGLGAILITAASEAVCMITTGSVDTSGAISYAQF